MLKIPDVTFLKKPPFPGLPTSLLIAGERFDIKYSENLGKDRDCWGCEVLEARTIVLDAVGCEEHIRITLTHEILHALLGLGNAHGLNPDVEEQVVRALTPFLHSALKSNPLWV